MPKKLCVRTLMNSEYVKVSKKFHKSAPRYFCHIFRSLCTEICSKNFVSVVPEILRLFVNTLTPNDTYSVSVKANVWHNQFKLYYLIIKKYFFHFFFFFCISGIYIKFEILWEKRWASEIICLWNYRLQKAELPKKPSVRTLMDSQHVKGSETLDKSAWQYFCLIFWSMWKKIGPNTSVLVVYEILRLFVNILTPIQMHSLWVKANI